MNHEFWNEIGNLYFMCGAYEPAIHAYLRAIKMENTFGRSYTNLAMAYVQTGKYTDAVKLYRRSIELLADKKEKAAAWNRLGILYRQIKEYDKALEAYQRADLIMPQEEAEKTLEAAAIRPLTVSMPVIDLGSILAKGNLADIPSSDLATEINAEFEMAEAQPERSVFDDIVFETYSQVEEPSFEPPAETQSEWKLAYAEETIQVVPVEQELIQDGLEDVEIIVPVEVQKEVTVESLQLDAPAIQEMPVDVEEISAASQVEVKAELVEDVPFFETVSQIESVEAAANETEAEAAEYSQPDQPLTDLSPEEKQALTLEIIKYQQATNQRPRSYVLWEGLGEAYKSAGQYKDAIQAFQKAITMNPTNPMSHYRLGLVYAAERKEQEAIKCFKKVLELDPNSAQAHASLASQYRKMGFEDTAQEHIDKARALQFEGESDYNHACLEAICGNNERALQLLEVALQSKQTYITWAQSDPDFDSLRQDQRFQTLLATYATPVAV